MGKMTACCGLDCAACPAFIATQSDDPRKRAETARLWSEQFHAEIEPEDINCDGCQSKSGRLFTHPRVCQIRKCGIDKQVSNCGHCSEYACGQLTALFEMAPEAKAELDRIHQVP
jgi:hypothetical protein